MPEISFTGLVLVMAVAFVGPLLLAVAPRVRLPAVVLEIVAGIVIGPAVLGLVHIDLPIRILSLLGLAFLLFLAGLEIHVDQLRGRPLALAGLGFAISLALGLLIGLGLMLAGLVKSPLLIAVILSATSLGLVIPLLSDAGQALTGFGQQVIAAASMSDFGAVILLSLLFSTQPIPLQARLGLLAGFVVVVVVLGIVLSGARRIALLSRLLVNLQDTTAQIRVRGAMLLLLGLVAAAQRFGVELLLAAFMAGAILTMIDRDQAMTHPALESKLHAIGYGFLIPIFFVSSGVQFDIKALLTSPIGLAEVPLFLAALIVVRGLPALLYVKDHGRRRAIAAGLLQATSLPFIVAAVAIGQALGLMRPAAAAAIVAAGLGSVIFYPLLALILLREAPATTDAVPAA